MRKVPALIALLILPNLGTHHAFAQAMASQDLQALRSTVSDFVAAQLGPQPVGTTLFVEPGALDPRLRLASCPSPEAFLPQGSRPAARFTVGVRCANPAWSLFLPVNVESESPVLVLRQASARGASLSPEDVELQRRRIPGFATLYLSDTARLTGRHLKQSSAPGTALTVDLLVEDIKVKRGQRVTLVAAVGSLEVKAPGEAIADARPDGRVRVQNLSSGKIVEGSVETADTVRVGP